MPFVRDIPKGETLSVIKDVIGSPRGMWFDCVRGPLVHGYVNDTGIIDGLMLNPLASILLGHIICGDVILFGSLSPRGEHRTTFSLNDEYVDHEYDVPDSVVDEIRNNWNLWQTSLDAHAAKLELEDYYRVHGRSARENEWCALWGSNPGPAD